LCVGLGIGSLIATLTAAPLSNAQEKERLATRANTESSSSQWGQGKYFHSYFGASIGRGLRFNNPYRLSKQLGDDAESLSLSATYLDLALAGLLGNPTGLQHGATVHFSVAMDGIQQEVLTPAYTAFYRLSPRWALRGHFGLPIVLEPDASTGFELAGGGVFFLTGGVGITADLVGDLFYGAATRDVSVTVIPIVSCQAGLIIDYEVLP
jgi:hypothetical protein